MTRPGDVPLSEMLEAQRRLGCTVAGGPGSCPFPPIVGFGLFSPCGKIDSGQTCPYHFGQLLANETQVVCDQCGHPAFLTWYPLTPIPIDEDNDDEQP